MSSVLWVIEVGVVFLAMICILVAAHEYGHYLFARLFGMGVEEFAIGMGKRVKVWRRKTHLVDLPYDSPLARQVGPIEEVSEGAPFEGGTRVYRAEIVETPKGPALKEETEFTFRLLPIGGFVRIKGMVPQDDGSEVRIPGGFYSKPPWQRLIVLVAGPAFSVLSGMLLLFFIFWSQGSARPDMRPILKDVAVSSAKNKQPAWEAKLQPGDEIVAINGKAIRTSYDLVQTIQSNPEVRLSVEYRRGGKLARTELTPIKGEAPIYDSEMNQTGQHEAGLAGILMGMTPVPLSAGEAAIKAVQAPQMIFQNLAHLIQQPSRITKEAGSAVTMVRVTNDALKDGPVSMIAWMALLSISVGIFNLLPVPPLDGGQMVMALAELLRGGRRLSMRVQQAVVSAGMLAVLLLVCVVLFVDFSRLFGTQPEKPQFPSVKSTK